MTQVAELVRVALTKHEAPVSRIVAIALKMLKRQSSGVRLIVSYADPHHGHVGAIYQAGNWIYSGDTSAKFDYMAGEKVLHRRSYTGVIFNRPRMILPKGAQRIMMPPKHRYLMPLDDTMRKQIEPLRKPYPKREPCGRGEIDSAAESNPQTGGASPTHPLLDLVIERVT